MMRTTSRTLLLFLSVAVLALPAVALADNKIIIIKRDGTSEEVILPDSAPVPDSTELLKRAKEKKNQKGTKEAPSISTKELMDKSEEKPKPVEKVAPEKKKVTPKAKPSAPVPKKQVKKKAKPKPKAKKQPTAVPLPPPKPDEEGIARAKAAKPRFEYIDPANIPAGTLITRDLATRAALEVAPPSRGFDVFQTTYKDRPAFQVRFKTDSGPHDVVVDAETGKVLKK